MLSGDNGLLTKAGEAKDNSEKSQAIEQAKMDIIGKVTKNLGNNPTDIQIKEVLNKYFDDVPEDLTDQNQELKIKSSRLKVKIYEILGNILIQETLPSTSDTKPYFPDLNFKIIKGTNLDNGLVITDALDSEENSVGNEFVWIEVPISIYENNNYNSNGNKKPSRKTDYSHIEYCLRRYVSIYDDSNLDNYDNSFMNETTVTSGGQGIPILNENEYNNLKNKMLSSVYEHGGFWIARYETGTEIPITQKSDNNKNIKAFSKPNLYPLNWVTRNQAQYISNQILKNNNYTSSLLFGVQWNLVLKYLEVKTFATQSELKNSSVSWGNYKNSNYTITSTNASYSINYIDWNKIITNSPFTHNKTALLTTGSETITDTKFVRGNIFDLAGNVAEFTLEKGATPICSWRGGSCDISGSNYPATYCNIGNYGNALSTVGFRICIF